MELLAHAFAVSRKEWQELRNSKLSIRSTAMQAAVVIGLTGIFIPITAPGFWNYSAALGLYWIFPCTTGAALAAESLGSEMERGTLETLLATPVSGLGIAAGKALLGAAWSLMVSYICIAGCLITALHARATVHWQVVAVTTFGAIPVAVLTVAVGLALAAWVRTAKGARSGAVYGVVAAAGAAAACVTYAGPALGPMIALLIFVAALAVMLLYLVARLLQREDVLDRSA